MMMMMIMISSFSMNLKKLHLKCRVTLKIQKWLLKGLVGVLKSTCFFNLMVKFKYYKIYYIISKLKYFLCY
jgi:hypothetical protein